MNIEDIRRPDDMVRITTPELAQAFIDEQIALVKEQVGDKKVLLALSGGVDSSVVAALLIKAIGDQLVCVHVNHGLLRKGEPDMLFYYNTLKLPHDPAADVKVENIKGPVLLISGGADVMVPAKWVCGEVMNRLDQHGFTYPHRHLNYEVLSHYTCPLRPMTSFMIKVERKHKQECNANREKGWRETLRFLREEWCVK